MTVDVFRVLLNPSRTVVPFWGTHSLGFDLFSLKRDCSSDRVERSAGTSLKPDATLRLNVRTALIQSLNSKRSFCFGAEWY